MKFPTSVAATALSVVGPTLVMASCKTRITSEKIQADITEANLRNHLEAFEDIAYQQGNGDRAFGRPGYAASVDYVWSHISSVPGTTAWKQDFTAWYAEIQSLSLTVDGEDVPVWGFTYAPSTPPAGITAELVAGPSGTAGCSAAGYAGIDVAGKIVVLPRGDCAGTGLFVARVRAAKEAGAAAVILHQEYTLDPRADTLVDYDPDAYIPAGYIRYNDGVDIVGRLRDGETIEATFQHTQLYEQRATQNVFVETDDGDPNSVVIFGAHLDSVQDSPGTNDNASGVSIVIELFKALQKYTGFTNKVRFAWWGATENGRHGSRNYLSGLTAAEADAILAYLEFNFVSQAYIGISDNNGNAWDLVAPPGSQTLEQIWIDHFVNDETTDVRLDNATDYASFWQVLNKPFAFLQGGTEAETNPCHHAPCDNITNTHAGILEYNGKGAAHMLAVLSTEGHILLP